MGCWVVLNGFWAAPSAHLCSTKRAAYAHKRAATDQGGRTRTPGIAAVGSSRHLAQVIYPALRSPVRARDVLWQQCLS